MRKFCGTQSLSNAMLARHHRLPITLKCRLPRQRAHPQNFSPPKNSRRAPRPVPLRGKHSRVQQGRPSLKATRFDFLRMPRKIILLGSAPLPTPNITSISKTTSFTKMKSAALSPMSLRQKHEKVFASEYFTIGLNVLTQHREVSGDPCASRESRSVATIHHLGVP